MQTKLNVDSSVWNPNFVLKTPNRFNPVYLCIMTISLSLSSATMAFGFAYIHRSCSNNNNKKKINVCKWKLTTVVASSDRFPKSFDFHSFLSSFKYFFFKEMHYSFHSKTGIEFFFFIYNFTIQARNIATCRHFLRGVQPLWFLYISFGWIRNW